MNNTMRKFLSWGAVVVWAGVIFYLSGIPSLSTGWGIYDFVLRKIAHMFEFGVLTFLFLRAHRLSWPGFSFLAGQGLAVVFSVVYAMSDEFHQSFVPGRSASVGDVLIDACGIVIFLLCLRRSQVLLKWVEPSP